MNQTNWKGRESTAEVQKIMIDHLTTKGYPNLTGEEILREVKALYLILEEAGLMPLTYPEFSDVATMAYFTVELMG